MKFSYSVPSRELQRLIIINYFVGLEDSGTIRNPAIRTRDKEIFYAEFELVDRTKAHTIDSSMRMRYNANRKEPAKLP